MNEVTLKKLQKAASDAFNQAKKLVNPQSSILPYSDSPQDYIEKHLKRFLTPQQKLVCSLINEYPYRVLMRSANNVGKCVHPDDYLPVNSGQLVKAKDLVNTTFTMLTWKQGNMVKVEAKAAYDEPKECFKITLESGEVIRRTWNHPIWSSRGVFKNGHTPKIGRGGWVKCKDLIKGDLVAVPLSRDYDGSDQISDDKAKLLAYLIGDNFVRRMGLMHCHSRDKFIPSVIMSASMRQIAIFLNRLYSTDGWASVANGGSNLEIGFCSMSERLCRDIQELLSRFGIRSSLAIRSDVNAWTLGIRTTEDLAKFISFIGIYGKEFALAEIQKRLRRSRTKWMTTNSLENCRWEKIRNIESLGVQESIAIEVPDEHTFVTCIYEHNTYLLASLANWFYDCFNPSLCRATATTAPQVDQGFFREFRNLRGNDVNFMPSASVLFDNPNHNVIGFTAKNPDAFQGLHAPNQMFLFDEGTGIDLPFWQRGVTMHQRQKGSYWIAAYNPNDPSSHVVDIEDDDWHIVELNALEHPNIEAELLGLAPPVPSAVRLDVIFSRIKKECQQVNDPDITTDFNFPKGSQYWWRPLKPEFEAQILGRWPILPTESLLSPKQVFHLGTVHQPVDSSKKLVVSCDVARFGNDKTCIMIRRGLAFLECIVLSKRNGPDIVEKIKELIGRHKVKDELETRVPIVIDATGGYGGTVQDHLPGYNVILLTMNAKSPNLLYKNLRSALWFTLHDVILTKSLDCMRFYTQDLHNLQRDLTAPRYRIDEQGRKYLEPKNQTKSRLGRSPDLGDTMALSMYELLA